MRAFVTWSASSVPCNTSILAPSTSLLGMPIEAIELAFTKGVKIYYFGIESRLGRNVPVLNHASHDSDAVHEVRTPAESPAATLMATRLVRPFASRLRSSRLEALGLGSKDFQSKEELFVREVRMSNPGPQNRGQFRGDHDCNDAAEGSLCLKGLCTARKESPRSYFRSETRQSSSHFQPSILNEGLGVRTWRGELGDRLLEVARDGQP